MAEEGKPQTIQDEFITKVLTELSLHQCRNGRIPVKELAQFICGVDIRIKEAIETIIEAVEGGLPSLRNTPSETLLGYIIAFEDYLRNVHFRDCLPGVTNEEQVSSFQQGNRFRRALAKSIEERGGTLFVPEDGIATVSRAARQRNAKDVT